MRRLLLSLAAIVAIAAAGLLSAPLGRGQLLNIIHNSKTAEQSYGNGSPSQPWPITSAINAINYDIGGSGIGYVNPGGVNPSCLYASPFRPDTVNFKTSTAGPAYQLGCSSQGNIYKYTIAISGAGPFTITANLADSSAGGSWGVAMDGSSIGTIATPNTGNFTTFQGSSLSAPFNATAGNHTIQFTALGGDASFNGSGDFLSFQISSAGGIACDVGVPFTGTVPRVAQVTGMTHCAFNFDVTNPAYASVSSWLDCAGSGSPTWFLDTSGSNDTNCGNITVATDPATNTQAVKLHYTAGMTDTQITTANNSTGSPAMTFGQNAYREVVYRIPAASYTAANQPSLIMANWSLGICWLTTHNFNCASNWEVDNIEQGCNGSGCGIPQNGGDSAWHDWNVGGSSVGNEPVNGSPLTDANYHSYGALITADGSAHLGMCSYQDGSALASGNGTNCDAVENRSPVNAAWFTQRSFAINTVGPQHGGGLAGYGSLDVYLKSFTIWVPSICTNWQTSECNGGPVYESTPP